MAKHETKERRREQIFSAAMSLTVEKGYTETSMDDIATEAGISKGNIYYHFKSKQELFIGLYNQLINAYLERFSEIVKNSNSATEIIRKILTSYDEMVELNQDAYKAVFEFYMQGIREPELLKTMNESLDYFIKLIKSVIDRGIENGEFRKEIDSLQSAKFIMAAGDGLKLFHLLLPSKQDNKKDSAGLAALFIDHLRRRGS